MTITNNSKYEIGARIRALREGYGYTREIFAAKAEISAGFAACIELRKKGMTAQTLLRIADALHVSADYLIYGTEKEGSQIAAALCRLNEIEQYEVSELLKKAISLVDASPHNHFKNI